MQDIRFCKKHGNTEFYYNKKYNKYLCKKCNQESVESRKREKKLKLVEYKGGKCSICGYDKCPAALEFHHLDMSEKDYGIGSHLHKSFEFLKKEADKCILVCANCHRELHFKYNEEKRLARETEENKNLSNAPEKRKIYSIDYNAVLSFINEGLKKDEMAKMLNVSVATLTRYFSKVGINLRRGTRCLEELEEPDQEELIRLRKEGLSFSKIGKKFKRSRNYISGLCKRYGIE